MPPCSIHLFPDHAAGVQPAKKTLPSRPVTAPKAAKVVFCGRPNGWNIILHRNVPIRACLQVTGQRLGTYMACQSWVCME